MQILVFGTSNTYGCWDEEGGWVTRLRKYIDSKVIASEFKYLSFSLIYNLGITGDTTAGILKRFDDETKRRIDPQEETLIIFHVGINDSQYLNAEKKCVVPADDFRKNLTELAVKARALHAKIVCVGLSPVDDSLVDPIPWANDRSYKTENVDTYDTMLKTFCEKADIPFLDSLQAMRENGDTNLLADGVHPTAEGHKIIFEQVKQFLEDNQYI